jgi:uncharacterized protein YgiM (DUF1202 family)
MITEGESVHVIEEDDGSGWVKVTDSRGGKGLVPAAYLKVGGDEDVGTSPSTTTATSQQVSGSYGEHLHRTPIFT